MTVYEFLKSNDKILKTSCKHGFTSSTYINYVEIIDFYFLRLERGRKGTNARLDTIDKFNISNKHFCKVKKVLLSEV